MYFMGLAMSVTSRKLWGGADQYILQDMMVQYLREMGKCELIETGKNTQRILFQPTKRPFTLICSIEFVGNKIGEQIVTMKIDRCFISNLIPDRLLSCYIKNIEEAFDNCCDFA